MAWSIEFTKTAVKQLRKIDRIWQTRILDYLEEDVSVCEDPRMRGKALVGTMKGLWRYRVGDYRLLCDIRDEKLVVLVVTIGHRSDVYG